MGRRKTREMILQIIFQMDFHKETFEENAFQYLQEQPLSEGDRIFTEKYIKDLIENQEMIDDEIKKNLKGWNLGRLSKVDLAILRIAAYEIMFEEDIPSNVAINEAVELAKKYSEEESRKFINGVLDAIAHREA